MQYDFSDIETRWQKTWADRRTFRAINPGEEGFDPKQPKYYVLDMFPYPSGVGLHVGHPLGYIATDIIARYKRSRGFNVLHPMGYDAFGLPAEQFAVEHGVHPRITTEKNIANMTRQLKRLGLSYDWDRQISTTDTDYYKWTQWIFLQLFNSWTDPTTGKARPIGDLIQLLESGEYDLGLDDELVSVPASGGMDMLGGPMVGNRRWHELEADEQRAVIQGKRLAYLAEVPVNWCPALGTVLANEEVTSDGKSERGNHPVFKRPLKQWMLRITDFAPRLISDLDKVDWPEAIKLMQRNWIGQSIGAQVDFTLNDIADEPAVITVFTTRPDTLFGATYMVLAPEHPLVDDITTSENKAAVNAYRLEASRKSDIDRQAEVKTKTGVFTGAHAINPVNGQPIPIWIADYVMMNYGTGAIMAVPAHDTRDFDFAKQFKLPVIAVVAPDDKWLKKHAIEGETLEQTQARYIASAGSFDEPFTDKGLAINSANEDIDLVGKTTVDAKQATIDWLEDQGTGRASTQYKLRDWLFSRQRYWGEPFPILHGPEGEIIPLKAEDLPVLLPEMDNFSPSSSDDPNAPPQPPLARASDDWKYVERDGKRYTREFNTMPQWAGSCWYYLRFMDAKNDNALADRKAENYWMEAPKEANYSGGVDLYVGGAEHAVLHLLYARFWHKVLFDLGHVSTPEPFGRLFNQGYIQAYAYVDSRGIYVPADEIEERDEKFYYKGEEVRREFGKMGKSLKNAVTPDDVCEEYGTDTLRLYEMYMGPLDQSKVWNTRDIVGVHRFLQRVWRNFVNEDGSLKVNGDRGDINIIRLTHKTIKNVTEHMDRLSFNTAIADLIKLNNELVAMDTIPRPTAEAMVLLLAPMAPHIAEELWQRLGHEESLARAPWPTYDPSMLVEETVELPVQVNGKLKSKVTIASDADEETAKAAALADERVIASMAGKAIRKFILVKGKMINIVVG